MTTKNIKYLALLLTHLSVGTLASVDLPVFYRAAMLQNNVAKPPKDWTTTLSVRYSNASAKKGWDPLCRSCGLLSIYGNLDLTRMGWYVENQGTKTSEYWGSSSTHLKPGTLFSDANDGKIRFDAKFKEQEAGLYLQQNLFSGLFISLYAPYRDIKLDRISYRNLGADSITSTAATGSLKTNITSLMSTDFQTILTENNFKYAYNNNHSNSGIADLNVSLGWQGYDDKSFNIIDSIGGSLQIGALFPCVKKIEEDKPFDIPLGYNDFVGFTARGSGEIGIWKYFALGAYAGANVFTTANRILRMKTNKDQCGWLELEKGFTNINPGSMWDLGAYVKVEPAKGLSLLVGYSFVTQESTSLNVKDDNFLSTYAYNQLHPTDTTIYPIVISKNDIVNSDERLHGWHQNSLHAAIRYDGINLKTRFTPLLEVEYDYPFYGKRSFDADIISGTLGVKIGLNF